MGQMTKDYLTSGDIRIYIKQAGTHCPYCGLSKIEACSDFKIKGSDANLPMYCWNCGKRWSESYRLYDIVEEWEDVDIKEGAGQE